MKSARNSIWKIDNFMFFFVPRLFIVVGATLSIEGCLNYQAAANFWNNAVGTTGTIIRTRLETTTYTHTSTDGFSSYTTTDSYFISTIRFTTLQREIMTFESDPDMCINRPSSSPCEGRKVEIFYDSSNPHQAIVKGSASPLVRVITRIGGGMFVVIFGIIFIKFNRDFEKFDRDFNRSFGRNIHR